MDHLPLPHNPTIGSIEVPFLCTEQYDGGAFKQWPQRHNIELESYHRRITFKKNGQYIVDPAEIGSLLQTWLYFGLLREFVDKDINFSQFENTSSVTKSRLLSSRALSEIVGQRSVEIVESEWAQDNIQLATWRDHIFSCLFEAGDIVDLIAIFCEMQPFTVLTPISLSIGALAEYLMRALKDVCAAKKLPLRKHLLFRLGISDVAAPILRLMGAKGWCPNHLAFFKEQTAFTIGMLWYFANLELPQFSSGHKDCTIKQCLALQVDERNYRTAHMTDQCGCQFIGLCPEELAETVRSGDLPLFNVTNSGTSDMKLALSSPTDEHGENEFVAISHVWADGYGNPIHNQLPACVLRYIQGAANSVPRRNPQKDMRIWMDTICVPLSPPDLRHQALTKMNDPYKKATCVLVFDRYLRSIDAESLSPADVFARIMVSEWHQRLWTLAEARLAKLVLFAFRRSLEEIRTQAQRHRENYQDVPSLPITYVQSNVISSYKASAVFTLNETHKFHEKQIPSLRAQLSTRATSRASDEALCLGLILGLDLSPILETDDAEKMVLIWKSFVNIPVGLAFSKALPKLSAGGCRWGPSSMMSIPENVAWGGPSLLLSTELRAQPTAQGLRFVQPTIFWQVPPSHKITKAKRQLLDICCPSDPKAGRLDLWLRDAQSRWFLVSIDEAWHQDSSKIDVEAEMPAIILTQSIQESKIMNRFSEARGEYLFGPKIDGLFVTFDSSLRNVPERRAKAHRHIAIQQVSERESKEYEGLQRCAERMLVKCPEVAEQVKSVPFTAMEKYPAQFTAFIEDYARTHNLIEPGRLTRAHRGHLQTDQIILMYFNIVVKYFVYLRDFVQIAEDSSPVPWIID